MASSPSSGIATPSPGVPLDRILASGAAIDPVTKAELDLGDTVMVTTRNSVYCLCAMGDELFAVSGGWFDRDDPTAPQTLAINGCTWGGSVIKHDIVAAPGLFLEFANGVKTTRIQRVQVVRARPGETAH
ncbi:MAG: hypothetical protein ACE5IK_05985 [Acidobacteriota bacterium]